MEEKILQKIDEQNVKLDSIYKSVEQARKLFIATLVITVVTLVLPMIGMVFIIPWFMSVMGEAYSGLL